MCLRRICGAYAYVMRRAQFKYTAVRDGCVSAVCPRHGAARAHMRCVCNSLCRHGAAAVRRNTVRAAYLRCCSSERQNTAQHGGCAEAKSRSCASHLRRCVKDRAFPQKRDIRHAGHPRKSAQTAGFCCREAHLGYLSDNYTSEKGCLSIPQTQNIPVRGFRGAFFVPEARAGRGRYTRQRSAYRNKRKRAAADMPHRGVEKVYAPNAPGCAKIRFPYHKHRTRRIGGTKFHPRKRGYNICEQPRFSR